MMDEKARKHARDMAHKSMKFETSNREFANTEGFKQRCENAGVKPTKRQASKFRNKRGSVYNSK